jgi:hypothetical protein
MPRHYCYYNPQGNVVLTGFDGGEEPLREALGDLRLMHLDCPLSGKWRVVDGALFQGFADHRTDEQRLQDGWSSVRQQRSGLLDQSDWTQMPDAPLPTEHRTQWAQYRQALRDITLQPDPFNIVWPSPPG